MNLIGETTKIKAASAIPWQKLNLYLITIAITGTFFLLANESSLIATLEGLSLSLPSDPGTFNLSDPSMMNARTNLRLYRPSILRIIVPQSGFFCLMQFNTAADFQSLHCSQTRSMCSFRPMILC